MEEVILGLLTGSAVPSGVALTCTSSDTAGRVLFLTLGFFVRLLSEVEVLGHLAVGTAVIQGVSAAQKSEYSVPQSALTLEYSASQSEFSVSSLPSFSSTHVAVSGA